MLFHQHSAEEKPPGGQFHFIVGFDSMNLEQNHCGFGV